jgi:hypothetical protein
LRAPRHGDLRGKNKGLTLHPRAQGKLRTQGQTEAMKLFDRLCAGTLFILALVDCLLVPKTYTGRIWIFGTSLALFFTAMLNVLRLRNGRGVRGLKLFCITANVTMFVFVIAVMASIGKSRTLEHPQITLVGALLLAETAFSMRKNSPFPSRSRMPE